MTFMTQSDMGLKLGELCLKFYPGMTEQIIDHALILQAGFVLKDVARPQKDVSLEQFFFPRILDAHHDEKERFACLHGSVLAELEKSPAGFGEQEVHSVREEQIGLKTLSDNVPPFGMVLKRLMGLEDASVLHALLAGQAILRGQALLGMANFKVISIRGSIASSDATVWLRPCEHEPEILHKVQAVPSQIIQDRCKGSELSGVQKRSYNDVLREGSVFVDDVWRRKIGAPLLQPVPSGGWATGAFYSPMP